MPPSPPVLTRASRVLQVDRFMQTFAASYYNANKDEANIFKHEDACYTLAFSTMMLQTALHNPQV
jgi:Sec7-like guanine-nucleotide exchange factor